MGGDVADGVDGGGWPLPRDPRAPRLIAPLSTTYTTHRRPTLRWELPPGAAGSHVQVCRDRACSQVETELRVSERSARPAEELAPGIHFWRVFGTDAGGADATPPSFVWEFFAPHRSTPRDDTRGQFLDVNGDGYADVAFAVERDGFAVYFGRPGGPAETHNQYFHSREREDNVYAACPNVIGDVNGDGFGDVLWGCNLVAPQPAVGPMRRAAEVLYGSPNGLVRTAPAHRLLSEWGWHSFGEGTSSMGDSNLDGYGDFVVGATERYLQVGVENQERPRPQVYLGSATGPDTAHSTPLERPNSMAPAWGNLLEGGIGDVNGDGYHDLLLGEDSFAPDWHYRAYLYLGTSRGLSERSMATLDAHVRGVWPPRRDQQRAGPCDLNGDGVGDVVLASQDERSSVASIFLGQDGIRATWMPDVQTRPSELLEDPQRSNLLVGCSADFNGDGYSDLLATSNARTPAFMWMGGDDLRNSVWRRVAADIPDSSGAPFRGVDVAAGGDVNGDGLSDVIVIHRFGDAWALYGSRVGSLERFGRLRSPDGTDYEGTIAF